MYKENEKTSYRHFLTSIKDEIITCEDLSKIETIEKRYVVLTHDNDDKLNGIIKMATIENELGIKATYNILHTSKIFDYSQKLIDIYKRLMDLGHNIGFHNDALTDYFYNKKTIDQSLSKPLNWLRKNGIKVVGTSAHGCARLYKDYGVRNEQIWKESNRPNPQFKCVSLKDYDFLYESYNFPYVAHLTDIYNRWLGFHLDEDVSIGDVIMDAKKLIIDTGKNRGLSVMDDFYKLDKGVIQILLHPPRWCK